MNGSNESVTPEWMSEWWLRKQSHSLHTGPLAREILRLRTEVEKMREAGAAMIREMEDLRRRHDRLKGKHGHQKQRADAMQEAAAERGADGAELRAARAEIERLTKRAKDADVLRRTLADTEAQRAAERDAAIRDRNEFAASELERFENDCWRDPKHPLSKLPSLEALEIRAAELRKAAGAAAPADLRGSIGPMLWQMVDGKITYPPATPPADLHQLPVQHPVKWRDECLEQIAAYVGYRPWRDFCAMKDRLAAAEKAKAELVEAARAIVEKWDDNGLISEPLLDALRIAAERAGGAS